MSNAALHGTPPRRGLRASVGGKCLCRASSCMGRPRDGGCELQWQVPVPSVVLHGTPPRRGLRVSVASACAERRLAWDAPEDGGCELQCQVPVPSVVLHGTPPRTGAASVREVGKRIKRMSTSGRMGGMNADGTVLRATCERRLAWDAPGTGAASLMEGKGHLHAMWTGV